MSCCSPSSSNSILNSNSTWYFAFLLRCNRTSLPPRSTARPASTTFSFSIPHLVRLLDSMRNRTVGDDTRRDEDQQFRALVDLRRALEQVAKERDVAQQRHLVHGVAFGLLEQAAQYHGAAVLHQ